MEDEVGQEISAGRRHIIERPRLTRLLDEASARVIMLVAPAGYGKTTLARQWLSNRPHAWYQGSASSGDVAALAIGIAEAAEPLVSDVGRRLREWLPTSREPEQEINVIEQFLVEDLADWPDDAWFVVDDYHLLSSEASEELIRLLFVVSGCRLLLTCRQRPTWSSARELLYGDFFELGQSSLAMNNEEANAVMASRSIHAASGLVALADGWPAVIGLAALSPNAIRLERAIPEQLHDYFADELFVSLPRETQKGLCRLALLPVVTRAAAEALIEPAAERVLEHAKKAGMFTAHTPEEYSLHPLLRTFLLQKLVGGSKSELDVAVRGAAQHLLEIQSWDEAFALIEQYEPEPWLLDELFRTAIVPLTQVGRLATLRDWLDFARRKGLASPYVDLAEAEIEFRQGRQERSGALAEAAASSLDSDDSLLSIAHYRAGQSRHLVDDSDGALQHFEAAQASAKTLSDVQNALWGRFIVAFELERQEAFSVLEELQSATGRDRNTTVRLECGRLMLALCEGGSVPQDSELSPLTALASEASDPLIRSAVFRTLAAVLVLGAQYREALGAVQRTLEEAESFHLEFVRAHSLVSQAGAYIGLRRFSEASASLREVQAAARLMNDPYLAANADILQCRLLLSEGSSQDALQAVSGSWSRGPTPARRMEFGVTKAAALACTGNATSALKLLEEVKGVSRSLEPELLYHWMRGICLLLLGSKDAEQAVVDAYSVTVSAGGLDTFVFANRLHPSILTILAKDERHHKPLSAVLVRSNDYQRATAAGIAVPREGADDPSLTRREREVYSLLAEGRSNREIAKALFISEATAKVHVRNILRKLGARSRVEVAIQAAKRRPLGESVAEDPRAVDLETAEPPP
jgi:LuxR family transcriptional regulator, maltose regulon positive regulatory protein